MTILYMFDIETQEYKGERPAVVVGNKEFIESAHATTQKPPKVDTGFVPIWSYETKSWKVIEDHRRKSDGTGLYFGGTGYWLPSEGDTWESEPRYMDKPGPLPDGAVTERPEKPLEMRLAEAKNKKKLETLTGYNSALSASLMLSVGMPTAQEIGIEAALMAAEDAEGLDFLRQKHAAKRDELLKFIDAAKTLDEIEAIRVDYAV